ncbi:hypothetical protein Syun_023296 [Stephania yunnanensis]|uniref:Uncharacterized protein n=1 Tax=Stephania yunnanensis TaxID=152371 RepID=A0AAP0FBF1_9MAGN
MMCNKELKVEDHKDEKRDFFGERGDNYKLEVNGVGDGAGVGVGVVLSAGSAVNSKARKVFPYFNLLKMDRGTPAKDGGSQSTPSPKCMKTIFSKMEDKFDTLRLEMKELMMRILASIDEEAPLAFCHLG